MNRLEQIQEASKANLELKEDEILHVYDRHAGFVEGAVWADNTMIEKACEWLFQTMVENNWISGYTDIPMSSEDVEQFRKAMKGGEE